MSLEDHVDCISHKPNCHAAIRNHCIITRLLGSHGLDQSDLFTNLTEDEKIDLLSGTGFTTQLIPRLGLPALSMADASQSLLKNARMFG